MVRMATVRALLLLPLLLSAPALASTVKITTDPPGALVQLDGVAYGAAPVTIPKVPAGLHELKVSLEGYVTRVDGLQVAEDQEVVVHAPLNPEPKVVPTPPKPVAPPPPPPKTVIVPPPPPPAAPYPPPVTAQPVTPPPPPPVAAPPAPARPGAALPPPPLPVSELPVAWGTQKKSLVLYVTASPANAMVQVIGLPDIKPAPAAFPGFAPGTVTVRVFAPGYKEQTVEVELKGDARTHVTLEPGS